MRDALEGFSPTPLFPPIAEAQALLAALAETDEVKAELRKRETRAKLHAGYALAAMMTKGFAAEETRAALARATSASGPAKTPEHWTLHYARINADLMSGDHGSARARAETFLAEAEAAGLPGHAAFACRLRGFLKFMAGELADARVDFERALADFDERRDAGLGTLFGVDIQSTSLLVLAQVSWYLGDFEAAERLSEEGFRRAKDLGQPVAYANALFNRMIGVVWRSPETVLPVAEELRALADQHDLKFWRAIGSTYGDWARVLLGEPRAEAFRAGVGAFAEIGARMQMPGIQTLLADVELAVGRPREALAAAELGLTLAAEAGVGVFRPGLLRLRGDGLAETDPAAAVAAYREALDVAAAKGMRPYVLLAAYALARLLETTGLAVEAHAALESALEGLSPTPHLPPIAAAQALLASLAEREEVKAELKKRETRSKLHAGYALATMMTKGFGAEDTQSALARAASASGGARTPEYWTVSFGRINADMMRGDLRAARAGAEAFLAEAAAAGLPGHLAFGRRTLGFLKMLMGELAGARADFLAALAGDDEARDEDLRALFGVDLQSSALGCLAQAVWYLGDAGEGARLTAAAQARAREIGHAASYANALNNRILTGAFSGRLEIVKAAAAEMRLLADEHRMDFWRMVASMFLDWTGLRLGEPGSDAARLRSSVEAFGKFGVGWRYLIADVERMAGRADEALATIETGLALAEETGFELVRPWLLRGRGEALAPDRPAAAVDALRQAVSVAGAQGSRAFGVMAALALARLLQSRGEPAEAHAALTPALDGLVPSPEMPAIAEAQALLAELAASEPVAAELRKRETRAKLHAGYALATMMTKGVGAEDTQSALARAASASGGARTPEYWTVSFGRINADMMRGDLRAARAGVEAFLAEAQAAGLPGHAAFARRMRGFLKYVAADFAGAREDLERALADYDERRDESLRTLFALDFRSNALAHLGLVAWSLGDPDEAWRLTDAAIERAKESRQPGSYAMALFNRIGIRRMQGRVDDVLAAAEEMRAFADEHDLKFWLAVGSTNAEWARVRRGEARAEAFRASLAALADFGKFQEAVAQPLAAEVELVAGRSEEALAAVERGLELAAETGVVLMRPWLMRLKGDALAGTDPVGAAAAYREALSLAGTQGARPLALLAALALARLLQSSADASEARAILGEALEGLAPTPLFPAIAEAQALLDQLPRE